MVGSTIRLHTLAMKRTLACTSYKLVQKGLLSSSAEVPLSATSTRCALSQLNRNMTARLTMPNSCRSLQVSCLRLPISRSEVLSKAFLSVHDRLCV